MIFCNSISFFFFFFFFRLQTALCVSVAGGYQAPITVTFQDYDHGDAPVRVENFCDDVFIKIHQK